MRQLELFGRKQPIGAHVRYQVQIQHDGTLLSGKWRTLKDQWYCWSNAVQAVETLHEARCPARIVDGHGRCVLAPLSQTARRRVRRWSHRRQGMAELLSEPFTYRDEAATYELVSCGVLRLRKKQQCVLDYVRLEEVVRELDAKEGVTDVWHC